MRNPFICQCFTPKFHYCFGNMAWTDSLESFIFKLLVVSFPCKYSTPPSSSSEIQIFTQLYFSSVNYSDEVFFFTFPSFNFIVLSFLLDVLCFFRVFYLNVWDDAPNEMLNCIAPFTSFTYCLFWLNSSSLLMTYSWLFSTTVCVNDFFPDSRLQWKCSFQFFLRDII